jgi:hypothetical protein
VPFGHVAIGDGDESGGPFVSVAGFDFVEGLAKVGGIEADYRVRAVFRALQRFGFDFLVVVAERRDL